MKFEGFRVPSRFCNWWVFVGFRWSVRTLLGSFQNIRKSSHPIFFLSSHVAISNIAPKITLGGRVKACKIIGCNSQYFWGYSLSKCMFYILRFFALATKMSV